MTPWPCLTGLRRGSQSSSSSAAAASTEAQSDQPPSYESVIRDTQRANARTSVADIFQKKDAHSDSKDTDDEDDDDTDIDVSDQSENCYSTRHRAPLSGPRSMNFRESMRNRRTWTSAGDVRHTDLFRNEVHVSNKSVRIVNRNGGRMDVNDDGVLVTKEDGSAMLVSDGDVYMIDRDGKRTRVKDQGLPGTSFCVFDP